MLISEFLTGKPELFSDDTSFFFVAQDITLSAKNVNDDLKKISK